MPPTYFVSRGEKTIRRKIDGRVTKILPLSKIQNIKLLLQKYGRIPVENLMSLYHYVFKEYLDPEVDFGTDEGFFGVEHDLVTEGISIDKKGITPVFLLESSSKARALAHGGYTRFEQLSLQLRQQLKQEEQLERLSSQSIFIERVFQTQDIEFWTLNSFKKLVSQKVLNTIIVDSTPFEMAMLRDVQRVKQIKTLINHFLANYGHEGIEMVNMPFASIMDKRLFNVTTLADFTDSYPEIFLKIKKKSYDPTSFTSFEDIIYDGSSLTYNDISQAVIARLASNPIPTAYEAIQTGLYQRTLLLIKKAGVNGLPIHVWRESMLKSFRSLHHIESNSLLNMDAIKFFFKLINLNLVQIRSGPHGRNDLRAFLPEDSVDFNQIYNYIKVIIDDSNSNNLYKRFGSVTTSSSTHSSSSTTTDSFSD